MLGCRVPVQGAFFMGVVPACTRAAPISVCVTLGGDTVATTTISGLARNPEAMRELKDGISNAYAELTVALGTVPIGAERWLEAAIDAVADALMPTIADMLDAALAVELERRRGSL